MSWYLNALKQYATFSGRARRKEYWIFVLVTFLFTMVALFIDGLLFGTTGQDAGYGLVYSLFTLAMLLPSLSVLVRRLHDVGKSGWWIFISLVPFIGGIWLLVLLLSDSQPTENQYGLNPKMINSGI
jgi:uncharacterized membrane protein YhaH (DUF805 family)